MICLCLIIDGKKVQNVHTYEYLNIMLDIKLIMVDHIAKFAKRKRKVQSQGPIPRGDEIS